MIQNPSSKWNDKKDNMNFSFKAEGFNIIGDIQLGDNQLVFEGKLPFLAKPFGGIVESTIKKKLEEILV